jgi:hypothetical protein
MSLLKECSRRGCGVKDIHGVAIEDKYLCRYCCRRFIKAIEDADRLFDTITFYKKELQIFISREKGDCFFVSRREEGEKIECFYDFIRGLEGPEDEVEH